MLLSFLILHGWMDQSLVLSRRGSSHRTCRIKVNTRRWLHCTYISIMQTSQLLLTLFCFSFVVKHFALQLRSNHNKRHKATKNNKVRRHCPFTAYHANIKESFYCIIDCLFCFTSHQQAIDFRLMLSTQWSQYRPSLVLTCSLRSSWWMPRRFIRWDRR